MTHASEDPSNPQAFPATGEGLRSQHYSQLGMTLRDYFAANALPVAIEITNRDPVLNGNSSRDLAAFAARLSYNLADAMLEARKAGA